VVLLIDDHDVLNLALDTAAAGSEEDRTPTKRHGQHSQDGK